MHFFIFFFIVFLAFLSANKIEGIDQSLELQTEEYYDEILKSHSDQNEQTNETSNFLPAVDDLSISLIKELSESLIKESKKLRKTELAVKNDESKLKFERNDSHFSLSNSSNSSIDTKNQNETDSERKNMSNLTKAIDEIKFIEKQKKEENISKTMTTIDLPLFPKFTENSFFSEIKANAAIEKNLNEKSKQLSDESFFSKKLSNPPPLLDFKNLLENTRKYENFKRQTIKKQSINKQILIDKIAKFENLVENYAQKSKGKLKEEKKDIIFKKEISIEKRGVDNEKDADEEKSKNENNNDSFDVDVMVGPQVNVINEDDVYRKLGPVPHFFSFE